MLEQSQKVKLSPDSEKEIKQSVSFDPVENWIYLTNDGNDISLSLENWFRLIDLSKTVIANLEGNIYENLKKSDSKLLIETLEKMNDLELIELAKIHDGQTEMNLLNIDSFSKKIYSELFKRAGIGFKQVSHLSYRQRNHLESLGLKYKKEKPLR